jgi:hypothetical protein
VEVGEEARTSVWGVINATTRVRAPVAQHPDIVLRGIHGIRDEAVSDRQQDFVRCGLFVTALDRMVEASLTIAHALALTGQASLNFTISGI